MVKDNTSHTHVVLFYKYFPSKKFPLIHEYPELFEERISNHQKKLCQKLGLKGRLLLSREGINGTLSAASAGDIDAYSDAMDNLRLISDLEMPGDGDSRPFEGIDWKTSTSEVEPFPDLKLSVVKEIISTGGSVSVDDVVESGGTHLSPKEFHNILETDKDVILIDVRNTFEYDIGHFQKPSTGEVAMNPKTVTFSQFDSSFCEAQAGALRDKKVLMYCTGGIRCEKASVMLKKRGVGDVSQLSGGIHRYLEEYGDGGFFKGRNFVFDQRVSVAPSECRPSDNPTNETFVNRVELNVTNTIVGVTGNGEIAI